MTRERAVCIGLLLRSYRGATTQGDLSRRSGVGSKTIGALERLPVRTASIKLTHLLAILRACGKSLADFERDLSAVFEP